MSLIGDYVISKLRFAYLDLARMVAACLVFSYHFYPSVSPFFSGSWLMVDFFFVLSGFVLSKQIRGMGSSVLTLNEFIYKRALRIYPPFLAFFFVSSILQIIQDGEFQLLTISIILGASLLLQVFSPVFLGTNLPLWSLSVELSVNILSRFFGRRLYSNLIGLFFGISLQIFYFSTGEHFDFYWVPVLGLGRALAGFNAGLIAMRVFEGGFMLPKFTEIFSLISTVTLICIAGDNEFFSVLLLPFFTLLVLGFAISPRRLILQNTFSFMGKMSYGFYIWHLPIGNTLDAFFIKSSIVLNSGVSVAILVLKLLTTFAVAVASYFLFEVNVRRILNRHSSRGD